MVARGKGREYHHIGEYRGFILRHDWAMTRAALRSASIWNGFEWNLLLCLQMKIFPSLFPLAPHLQQS
jgi:hypothetical protein